MSDETPEYEGEEYTLEQEVSLIQQVDNLKDENRRLLKNLAKVKESKEDLVEAIYRAALDGISLLDFKSVPVPNPDSRSQGEETGIAVLSDFQLAKQTPTYNSLICEKRIELYGDKLIEITNIQRMDHPVKELRVWLLGDIVEGELIFPGQQWGLDASLYRQVTVDGPRILCNFLRKMLTVFDNVRVCGVIGNHGALAGRTRREMNPETNADRMLYRIVQQIMESEPRLSWEIPDGMNERNWYVVDYIGKKGYLLLHGDQFRGSSGLPWYSIQKKVGGWRMGAIPEPFDYVVFGHYHQPTRLTLNNIQAICNGSTESHNLWAQEQLAAVGTPSQMLMFAHPENGITAEYILWLDEV